MKQSWAIDAIVKVGFCTLRVKEWNSVNGYWHLESLDSKKQYEFIPHNGLHRITKENLK